MAVRRHRRKDAERHLFVSYSSKDMLTDCQGLTAQEELAYRRLCDLVYTTGDNVIDDDALAEFARVGPEWPSVRASLLKKERLQRVRGRLTIERCQKEIAAATARKLRGKKGANALHGNTENGVGNPLEEKENVTSSSAQAGACGLPTNNEERITISKNSSTTQKNKMDGGPSPRSAPSDLAFAGKVIRLTWRDFARWTEAFRQIDLRSELTSRDDWLATLPLDDRRRKDWFMASSNWLVRRNTEAMRYRRDLDDGYDPNVIH